MKNLQLYDRFLVVAEKLNSKFNVTPLLYGSLGLELITDIDFEPQDIDVLVPVDFLNVRWNDFKKEIEGLGYELVDLHEHEFYNKEHKIAFAHIEELLDFADIDYKQIEVRTDKRTKYKTLNLQQYYQVYQQSSKDGYRKTKKNDKDQHKIEIITQLIEEKEIGPRRTLSR